MPRVAGASKKKHVRRASVTPAVRGVSAEPSTGQPTVARRVRAAGARRIELRIFETCELRAARENKKNEGRKCPNKNALGTHHQSPRSSRPARFALRFEPMAKPPDFAP